MTRKQEVYSLSWDQTDLSKFMIAGAQNGGPIGNVILLEGEKQNNLSINKKYINHT